MNEEGILSWNLHKYFETLSKTNFNLQGETFTLKTTRTSGQNVSNCFLSF